MSGMRADAFACGWDVHGRVEDEDDAPTLMDACVGAWPAAVGSTDMSDCSAWTRSRLRRAESSNRKRCRLRDGHNHLAVHDRCVH